MGFVAEEKVFLLRNIRFFSFIYELLGRLVGGERGKRVGRQAGRKKLKGKLKIRFIHFVGYLASKTDLDDPWCK